MKKNISLLFATAIAILLLWSCTKKEELVAPVSGTGGVAFIKIGQYSPNFRGVVNNRDSFNVYVGGVKLNGSFLTYGSLYPSSTSLYASVAPGSQSIKITLNGVNIPDSLTLATFTKTLTAGSYYSFIITDSLLNAAESKQIFVQDNFAVTDTTHFTIRFVHAILNDTTGKNVDIYSTRLAANMFSNVAPGAVSTFTSQPYFYVNDTLIVRRAGSLFELARLSTAASPLARQRAYTLLYKGLPAATTGTKARSLVTFANQ